MKDRAQQQVIIELIQLASLIFQTELFYQSTCNQS